MQSALQGGSSHPVEPPLDSFPPAYQEAALVEDLLHGFSGLDGKHIRARRVEVEGADHVAFSLAVSTEATAAALTRRLLPMCESAAVVQRHVQARSAPGWGSVAHAAGAVLRSVSTDLHLLTAQLQHRFLCDRASLQALLAYVHVPAAALQLAAGLCARAAATNVRGAALLDLLAVAAADAAGDATARPLLRRLLAAASLPYFRMLETWLSDGRVDDPYAEFMVVPTSDQERKGQTFQLRTRLEQREPGTANDGHAKVHHTKAASHRISDVPACLAPHTAAIIDTGRYLNVVRSAGQQLPTTLPKGIEFDESASFGSAIIAAHAAASKAALAVLQKQPVNRGSSVFVALADLQRVMLLQPCGWVAAFLVAAHKELHMGCGEAPLPMLQSKLSQVLLSFGNGGRNIATIAAVKAARDVRGLLQVHSTLGDDHTQMLHAASTSQHEGAVTGVAARQSVRSTFMMRLQVADLLETLLPPVAIVKYQALFRLHWDIAMAAADLEGISSLHRSTRRLPKAAAALMEAESVRCTMMHTVDVLRRHLAIGVVAPALAAQTAAFAAATTIEEASAAHEVCLETLLRGCFLSGRHEVLRRVDDVRRAASAFAETLTNRLGAIDTMRSGASLSGKPRTDRRGEHAMAAAASLQSQLCGAAFADAVAEAGDAFRDSLEMLICEMAKSHSAAQVEGLLPKTELVALQCCVAALLGGNNCVLRQDEDGICASAALAAALAGARLGPRGLVAAPLETPSRGSEATKLQFL